MRFVYATVRPTPRKTMNRSRVIPVFGAALTLLLVTASGQSLKESQSGGARLASSSTRKLDQSGTVYFCWVEI